MGLDDYRFQREFFEAGKRLPGRTRGQFYAAFLTLYFDGVDVSSSLPRSARDLFCGYRARVTMARAKTIGGSSDTRRVGDEYSASTDRVPPEYSPSTARVVDTKNDTLPAVTASQVQGSSPRVGSIELGSIELLGDIGSPHNGEPYKGRNKTVNEESDDGIFDAEAIAQAGYDHIVDAHDVNLSYERVLSWVENWYERGWVDKEGRSMNDVFISGKPRWLEMLEALNDKVGGYFEDRC